MSEYARRCVELTTWPDTAGASRSESGITVASQPWSSISSCAGATAHDVDIALPDVADVHDAPWLPGEFDVTRSRFPQIKEA